MKQSYLIVLIWVLLTIPTHAKTTLKVGYLPVLDHLTLLVSHAHDNATFQQVEIHPKMFKTWPELAGALKANLVDAALFISPLAMDLFDSGLPIQAVLLAHRDGAALTVKKDLSIQSPADLRGKTIALPHQKSTHTALLYKYLMRAQLSLKDVVTKLIAPASMAKALQQGKIDAFLVAEPFGSAAQSEGIGRILVLTKDILPHHIDCIVVVHQKLIQTDHAAIQEWVNSLIRAGKWIEKDKLEDGSKQVAKLTAQKYLPHSEATIIGGLQNPVDRISFADLKPNITDFQTIADLSEQAGILRKIDLKNFVSEEFYRDSSVK